MATPNTNRRLNRLDLVRRRAANRTRQRFQHVADELAFQEEERRLHEEVQQRASSRTEARMEENAQPEKPEAVPAHPLEQEPEESSEETQTSKPLNKLNKSELQEVASNEGVQVADDATNAQLVEAIEAHRKEAK